MDTIECVVKAEAEAEAMEGDVGVQESTEWPLQIGPIR